MSWSIHIIAIDAYTGKFCEQEQLLIIDQELL